MSKQQPLEDKRKSQSMDYSGLAHSLSSGGSGDYMYKGLQLFRSATCALCFIFLSVLAPPSLGEEIERPYKSTTVDECIQEKECFWHHFLLAVQTIPSEQKASRNIKVKKWNKSIRYRRYGASKAISNEQSLVPINNILPFVHQDFSVNEKFNFAVVFTDSIEHELSVNFKPFFDNIFPDNTALKL